MSEIFKALAFLSVSALCVFLAINKRVRVFVRHIHPPSRTEDGLMGWLVILLIVGLTSFMAGIALSIYSLTKLFR
ncbi:MAG: hypothetical protein ICV68_04310 [Pyrinomonadaceae bacterium]|nr:hypothetical protein [Pyrinomonadaceae bacterium]